MNPVTYLMKSRGVANTLHRLPAICQRFGIGADRMEAALHSYLDTTSEFDCKPTLTVTGVLLERYPLVFRNVAERPVELAVHGLFHTDYGVFDLPQQKMHMDRALSLFDGLDIPVTGFRCPYLLWNEDSYHAAKDAGLAYGSNRAVAWDVVSPEDVGAPAWTAYEKGLRLYGARPESRAVSLPAPVNGSLIDLPVSLPDDEALVDRLRLDDGSTALDDAWCRTLDRIYERGELFTVILHHERVPICQSALRALLQRTRSYDPPVWIASMSEIADWWIRRRAVGWQLEFLDNDTYRIVVTDNVGCTFLARGVEGDGLGGEFFGWNEIADVGETIIRSPKPPCIGLGPKCATQLRNFIRDEGYLIVEGADARKCAMYLERSEFGEADKRTLVDLLENGDAPLVRCWRWPNGARSALAVTGDVDAMTLVDFFRRPFER